MKIVMHVVDRPKDAKPVRREVTAQIGIAQAAHTWESMDLVLEVEGKRYFIDTRLISAIL